MFDAKNTRLCHSMYSSFWTGERIQLLSATERKKKDKRLRVWAHRRALIYLSSCKSSVCQAKLKVSWDSNKIKMSLWEGGDLRSSLLSCSWGRTGVCREQLYPGWDGCWFESVVTPCSRESFGHCSNEGRISAIVLVLRISVYWFAITRVHKGFLRL